MDSFSSSEKKLDSSSLPLSQTVILLRFPTKCRSNKSQSKNLHKDTSFPGYQTMDSASEHSYFPTFSFSVQKSKKIFFFTFLVANSCGKSMCAVFLFDHLLERGRFLLFDPSSLLDISLDNFQGNNNFWKRRRGGRFVPVIIPVVEIFSFLG